MKLDLLKIVNREQLLDFALLHIVERADSDTHPVAKNIVMWYIYYDFNERNIDFTGENVTKEYITLVFGYTLKKLAEKDLIQANINEDEVEYSITDKGRKVLNDSSIL